MDAFLFCSSVIIGFVVLLVLRSFRRKDRITRLVDEIPGPRKVPFLGTAYTILLIPREDLFRFAHKRLKVYGGIVRTWMGSLPVVHFIAPDAIESVLNNSINITKNQMYSAVHPWLGEGLLTSTGSKWFRHRKLITPTFHFKILENFMDVFVEKSENLVKILESKATGQTFDLYPFITRCTLDIICETAMGIQINALHNKENKYVDSIYGISRIIVKRLMSPWLLSDFIFYKTKYGKTFNDYLKTLHGFTKKVIGDRKTTAQATKSDGNDEEDYGAKKRKAFLDLFLDMAKRDGAFTDSEIQEQVDTFMFEGHDTTTAAMSWSLFLLGNHPEIQEQVYEEIDSVFQATGKNLTVNDLGELKLLERCIKESMRLYPSVPTIGRNLTEDVKVGKYIVPAGCPINLQIFLVHRNEEIYPNPEKFDPDRFLPENSKNRHPYAYIPFSAGPRNCIGQKFAMYEEKTMLAYILRNYKIKSTQTQENVFPMMELILRPRDGLLVNLERRKT